MKKAALLPTLYSLLPERRVTRLLFLLFGLLLVMGFALRPKAALADPHAVFYTVKGQEQVFRNVLAALNQADYVEPPSTPAPPANPQPFTEFDQQPDIDAVQLPRIRVRAVTPDDGDVYYRERVLELSRTLRAKVGLAVQQCLFYQWFDPQEFQSHSCPQVLGNSTSQQGGGGIGL